MQGAFYIFIAAILWGFDGVLRRLVYELPPITIVFYEHLIGVVLIAPFLFRVWSREYLQKQEWGALLVVALCSGVLGTLFFTSALLQIHFIPFSVVFLVQKLQPIFAVGMGAILLREYPGRTYWLWAGVALVAGFFVTFPSGVVQYGEGDGYFLAALYAFLAAVLWGSSTAFSRYTLLNHSYTFITGLRFLLTVPITLLFLWGLGASASLSEITWQQFGILFLISLSTGMVALWIYYRGLRTTPVYISTIVELAFPVTAVFIDYFLYGTVLTWEQYLAAIILFTAAYRVSTLQRALKT